MNRRSLLTLIGLAPIATAAAALPRVADPVKLASTGGREVSLKELGDTLGNVEITEAHFGERYAKGVFRCQSVATPEGALSTIGLTAKSDGASIGMELTAFTGGRQSIALKADQFVMSKRDGLLIFTPSQ